MEKHQYKDITGVYWVVVSKWQKRQTRGRFFPYTYGHKDLQNYISGRDMAGYTWDKVHQEKNANETIDETMRSHGFLLICRLDEIDEEVNEFGVVSP